MSRLSFTRASSASYFDAAGAMQTALTNAPRFDTNPVTLAALGLLIEESRSNLLLGSAAPVTQNCTVAATPYTLSFYGTGTVTLSGVSTAGPLVGSGAFPTRSTLTFTPTAGTLTLTVTGTVQYANLESGSFATSWIPTTGATATRAADVCSALTSSFAFNAAAGTVIGRSVMSGPITGNASIVAALSDGTNANLVQVFRNTPGGTMGSRIVSASSQTNPGDSVAVMTTGLSHSTALAYATGAGAGMACLNGALSSASNPVSAPVGITRLSIGINAGLSGSWLNGWISSLSYYPSRLSNAQLQALTQ